MKLLQTPYPDIEVTVATFKTKHSEGFVRVELEEIANLFPSLHVRKFKRALFGITTLFVAGEIVVYRHDVETALRCGLENRNLNTNEFD